MMHSFGMICYGRLAAVWNYPSADITQYITYFMTAAFHACNTITNTK
jgi:hypothetical protein